MKERGLPLLPESERDRQSRPNTTPICENSIRSLN
jgi:hypothetical protein